MRSALHAVGHLLGRATARLPRSATVPDVEARPTFVRTVHEQIAHTLRLALAPVRRGPPVLVPA